MKKTCRPLSTTRYFNSTQRNPKKAQESSQSLVLHDYSMRMWMKRRGKASTSFDNRQRSRIKKIFNELDTDRSGSLSLDEIYDPLMSLGLVESKEEVQYLMDKVDYDKSGLIEFNEFLQVLQSAKDKQGNNTVADFFKNLVDGKVLPEYKGLPFKLLLSNRRRELMLLRYTGKTYALREKGAKILEAFSTESNQFNNTLTSGFQPTPKSSHSQRNPYRLNTPGNKNRKEILFKGFRNPITRIRPTTAKSP